MILILGALLVWNQCDWLLLFVVDSFVICLPYRLLRLVAYYVLPL